MPVDEIFPNLGAGPRSEKKPTSFFDSSDWAKELMFATRARRAAKNAAKACPSLCLSGKSDEAAKLMRDIDEAESRQLVAWAHVMATAGVIAEADGKEDVALTPLLSAIVRRIYADDAMASFPEHYSSRPRMSQFKDDDRHKEYEALRIMRDDAEADEASIIKEVADLTP